MRIGVLWNKLADPKNIPRLFAFSLGIILIIGLIVPMALNPDQLYVRPAPQEQIDEGLAIAPYDRGGEVLTEPGNINPQYPENEILYYTRGFDTILESSILMMAFIIASWLSINYTMDRKNDENEIRKDVKKAITDSTKVANEVKANDAKARSKQLRRDN